MFVGAQPLRASHRVAALLVRPLLRMRAPIPIPIAFHPLRIHRLQQLARTRSGPNITNQSENKKIDKNDVIRKLTFFATYLTCTGAGWREASETLDETT